MCVQKLHPLSFQKDQDHPCPPFLPGQRLQSAFLNERIPQTPGVHIYMYIWYIFLWISQGKPKGPHFSLPNIPVIYKETWDTKKAYPLPFLDHFSHCMLLLMSQEDQQLPGDSQSHYAISPVPSREPGIKEKFRKYLQKGAWNGGRAWH